MLFPPAKRLSSLPNLWLKLTNEIWKGQDSYAQKIFPVQKGKAFPCTCKALGSSACVGKSPKLLAQQEEDGLFSPTQATPAGSHSHRLRLTLVPKDRLPNP